MKLKIFGNCGSRRLALHCFVSVSHVSGRENSAEKISALRSQSIIE